jgi:hypothetical protein
VREWFPNWTLEVGEGKTLGRVRRLRLCKIWCEVGGPIMDSSRNLFGSTVQIYTTPRFIGVSHCPTVHGFLV